MVLALSGAVIASVSRPSSAQSTGPAFSATAAADGVRLSVTFKGAPVTDNPVNAGFPTAQVQADSLGTGEAYAAFPDPGTLAQTAPGLVVGLLGQGGNGLPPIHLPSPPGYPLSVQAVRGITPDQTVGQGPYAISASSQDASTSASANGGLSLGGVGQASWLASSTDITQEAKGEVISRATSDVQGLAIGPLSIGKVVSTARLTLGTDGTVTRSRHLEIDGVQIGGLSVSISSDGLNLAGVPVPAPIGSTLGALLKAVGVTFELLPAQDFPDRVIAPAVRITVPVSGSLVGASKGTLEMTVGAATAYLSAAGAGGPSEGDIVPPTPASLSPNSVSTGTPAMAGPTPAFQPNANSGLAPVQSTLGSARPATSVGDESSPIGLFDIRSLYLLVAACALGAWIMGHLFRLLGVKRAWKSSVG
jgi:hypothetical protein